MGMIALPSMLKAGYEKSVAKLFTAAIFPGLLLADLYTIYVGVLCYLKLKIATALPNPNKPEKLEAESLQPFTA
ncbi:MAG: hypothetical protein B1H11_10780 [Desulfobacteraceae bacterium 4484_190.1]|nr:MAG: hypothetical protein B1H11_10780 [Desulfobacteraceae bacterium 4484_190.1]